MVKRRLPPWSEVLQGVRHADMAHGENVFWQEFVGVSLLPFSLLVRKMDATIGFGLGAMHTVVLGPAQVIRLSESRC